MEGEGRGGEGREGWDGKERESKNVLPHLKQAVATYGGNVHFLCAMRAFKVRASSSSPRLPFCQILFLLQPPLLS